MPFMRCVPRPPSRRVPYTVIARLVRWSAVVFGWVALLTASAMSSPSGGSRSADPEPRGEPSSYQIVPVDGVVSWEMPSPKPTGSVSVRTDGLAGGGGDEALELALLGGRQFLALVEGPVPGGHVGE